MNYSNRVNSFCFEQIKFLPSKQSYLAFYFFYCSAELAGASEESDVAFELYEVMRYKVVNHCLS